jgi:hypothetical protein
MPVRRHAVEPDLGGGADAWEAERPHVALADYQMPDMDGLALLRAVKREQLPARIVPRTYTLSIRRQRTVHPHAYLEVRRTARRIHDDKGGLASWYFNAADDASCGGATVPARCEFAAAPQLTPKNAAPRTATYHRTRAVTRVAHSRTRESRCAYTDAIGKRDGQ